MLLIQQEGRNKWKVFTKCHGCGKAFYSPEFTQGEWNRYQNGEHTQDVFPDWTPAERELFLISGICGKCFDEMMGAFEED